MSDRSLRGKVAVVGVGETTYWRHGKSPHSEFKLALMAILARLRGCRHRSAPDRRLRLLLQRPQRAVAARRGARPAGAALLQHELGRRRRRRLGAVGNAAAAVACGMADCVVVFRALAQGQFQRFGAAPPGGTASGEAAFNAPYGVMSPAQRYAMRAMRFLHENRIAPSAQRAIALASYHHAQANPRAVMHGRPLTAEAYDESRWIVEPWRLFDCCQENDGAAALIIVPAEQAKDFKHKPAYLLGSAQGSNIATARASTTRRSTRPRASPPWRRSSTTWRA